MDYPLKASPFASATDSTSALYDHAANAITKVDNSSDLVTAFVGGSVAMGCHDRYSDLDLGLVWRVAPSEDVRLNILGRLGGNATTVRCWQEPTRSVGNEDSTTTALGKIDLCHHSIDTVNTWIDDVVCRFETNNQKQILLSNLTYARPLIGTKPLEILKARVALYPETLAQRICEAELRAMAQGSGMALAERGEHVAFIRTLTNEQDRIFRTLLALNRTFNPGVKHLMWQLSRLRIVPNNCCRRYSMIQCAVPRVAWRYAQQLIDDVCTLIDKESWGLDTRSVRGRLNRIP